MEEQRSLISLDPHIGVTLLPEIPCKDNKGLWIFGESEAKRRVVSIEKKNGSYGFTLQSYGVRYKHGNRETDFITYVTAVEKDGASYEAGLREGDVILSINGQNMARVEHKSLVSFIRTSPSSLKMVVVSDERARKVELHMRYVHLQKKLQDKMKELDELNFKEKMITMGVYRNNPNGLADLQISSNEDNDHDVTSGRRPVNSNTSGGNASTNTASTVCCFCPQRSSSNALYNSLNEHETSKLEKQASQTSETQTVEIVRISNSEKRPRSKSIKVFDKETGISYDCYRKCQSSRELSTSVSRSRNNSISGTDDKAESSQALATGFTKYNPSNSNHHGSISKGNNERDLFGIGVKPKSWDNVMLGSSTRAFGGYGFGFGYGYYPRDHETTSTKGLNSSHRYNDHVTHPHHHNHHSHTAAHSHGNYYCNATGRQPIQSQSSVTDHKDRSGIIGTIYDAKASSTGHPLSRGIYERYDSIVNPYQYHGTITSTSTSIGVEATTAPLNEESINTRSKTLPSTVKKTSTSTPMPLNTGNKMERTLSDSSINSEHNKEFPKSISYFMRSGDNVRFSSDEEIFNGNKVNRHTTPNEREHIFV